MLGLAFSLSLSISLLIYIYIYAVESKLGPRFGFFESNLVQGCVKTWSKIFIACFPQFIVFFGYLKNHKSYVGARK